MSNSKKKNVVAHFSSGAIAGATDVLITQPLDAIKTNMQINPTKYRNPYHAFTSMIRTHGISRLYNGMIPFMIQTSGKTAIRFTTYNVCKDAITKATGKDGMGINFLSGVTAGAMEASIWTTPTERLKILKQTNASKIGISQIMKQHGVSGLFVGGLPTAIRQSSSIGFRMMMYDKVKQTISKDNSNSSIVRFFSGGIVGAASVCLNNPVDVIKSRRQSGDTNTYLQCIRNIYRAHGISGFYSGLSARAPRVFMGQAIQFTIYEKLYDFLSNIK